MGTSDIGLSNEEQVELARQQLGAARKDDTGKSPISTGFLQYFPRAIAAVAMVSQAGFEKYGAWGGWRKVDNGQRRYTDALGRHILAEGRGEAYDLVDEKGDPGTRCLHAALLAWNAMARLDKLLEENPQMLVRAPENKPEPVNGADVLFAAADRELARELGDAIARGADRPTFRPSSQPFRAGRH